MKTSKRRSTSGMRNAFIAAAVVATLAACSSAQSQVVGFERLTPSPGLAVSIPDTWHRVPDPPPSVGLVLLARGTSSEHGCPDPLLVVRQTGRPTGTLAEAVAMYNRLEQARRPNRAVVSQKSVEVPGTTSAVLIIAHFPAGEATAASDSGPPVQSFDLLALTTTGLAVHLYASGCSSDLPSDFLNKAVLSLRDY